VLLSLLQDCPWIGACVGGGNYRSFFAFLVCLSACIVLVLLGCALHLYVETEERLLQSNNNSSSSTDPSPSPSLTPRKAFEASLRAHPLSFALGLFAALVGALVLPLTLFHAYLVARGLSTYEFVKRTWTFPTHLRPVAAPEAEVAEAPHAQFHPPAGPNPFNHGPWHNCAATLCGCSNCCGGCASVAEQQQHYISAVHPRRPALLPPLEPGGAAAAAASSVAAPSAHARVRFVDSFEMEGLQRAWMRQHKTIALRPIIPTAAGSAAVSDHAAHTKAAVGASSLPPSLPPTNGVVLHLRVPSSSHAGDIALSSPPLSPGSPFGSGSMAATTATAAKHPSSPGAGLLRLPGLSSAAVSPSAGAMNSSASAGGAGAAAITAAATPGPSAPFPFSKFSSSWLNAAATSNSNSHGSNQQTSPTQFTVPPSFALYATEPGRVALALAGDRDSAAVEEAAAKGTNTSSLGTTTMTDAATSPHNQARFAVTPVLPLDAGSRYLVPDSPTTAHDDDHLHGEWAADAQDGQQQRHATEAADDVRRRYSPSPSPRLMLDVESAQSVGSAEASVHAPPETPLLSALMRAQRITATNATSPVSAAAASSVAGTAAAEGEREDVIFDLDAPPRSVLQSPHQRVCLSPSAASTVSVAIGIAAAAAAPAAPARRFIFHIADS
jgi:hypothetical protein